MEKIKTHIKLTSYNQNDLINPFELLFPLNKLVNLINLMENFEEIQKLNIHTKRDLKIDEVFERKIKFSPNIISSNRENTSNSVYIYKMSKQSPYWIDLLIEVSPYLIQVIESIIKNNQDDIEKSIVDYFKSKGLFQDVDEQKKQNSIRLITNGFRSILRFVSMQIENNN